MKEVAPNSVDLVVTSPPYPMIEMWDEIFSQLSSDVRIALDNGEDMKAFELMHLQLDAAWREVFRVLKAGGFACINIGDATRTINGRFVLYPNHMRILQRALDIGFSSLPCILWRKQTNAPNKFMGSGMLPAGAYVTLEHEYVLILRKGSKREFKIDTDKKQRRESAIFWEERNVWFSDVWFDIKGIQQAMNHKATRIRSGAYPFELAYRLINMYSVKGDIVLDPFLGTGTTAAAAIAASRNSIGYEIDHTLQNYIMDTIRLIPDVANDYIIQRIQNHLDFIKNRMEHNKPLKYQNKHYGFPVMTAQETEMLFNSILTIQQKNDGCFEAAHSKEPQVIFVPENFENSDPSQSKNLETLANSLRKPKRRNKATDKGQLKLSK